MNRCVVLFFAFVSLVPTEAHAYDDWLAAYYGCVLRHDPGCIPHPASSAFVHETDRTLSDLEKVNQAVNDGVRYELDIDRYRMTEWWTSRGSAGDCEDLQLKKKVRLIHNRYPARSMRLAIVGVRGYVQAGMSGALMPKIVGMHALLLVYTDRYPDDPYVLDNRTNRVWRLSRLTRLGAYRISAEQDAQGNWALFDLNY